MQNPQQEASTTKREHGLVEWLRPSLLRGVWSPFTTSPCTDRLSSQCSHMMDNLRTGKETGWVVVHPQAGRTPVQAGPNEPIGDEGGTSELDGWELVKLPLQGHRMTFPGNDSIPGKRTPGEGMPVTWPRGCADTMQRALGAITTDRRVDLSSAIRWAFRSQTTYELHPHVHRFPTTPPAISSTPACIEAEPVSTTPTVSTFGQPPCQPPLLSGYASLSEESSLEDASLGGSSAEDSSVEGFPLDDVSVEDAALEDAPQEGWSGLEVQAGVEAQHLVRTPRTSSCDLQDGARRASTGGGDCGRAVAAAEAPRRSVAWAADVRSRGASTGSAEGSCGEVDLRPDAFPPGEAADIAVRGHLVTSAPTLGAAEEESLRHFLAYTLPCACGPPAPAAAAARTVFHTPAGATPAGPSGRATCETFATARSTAGSVASTCFRRTTGETFVTAAEAVSPRSTADTSVSVSVAGTLVSVRRSGRPTAWSLDSAPTRGTTRCTLFSRGRRSTAWTLDGVPDVDAATRGSWAERTGAERTGAEWEEWQRDRAGDRSQAEEWWREEEKAEGRAEETEGAAAEAAPCAGDALPGNVRGHTAAVEADGRVRWVQKTPSWVAMRARDPTRRTSECSLFSARAGRGTDASAWELHWPPQRVTSWLEDGPPDWTVEDAAAASRGGDWGLRDSLRRRKERVSGTTALGSLRRRMAAADDAVAVA